MKSPIYWHPALYRFAIRRAYGPNFENRYQSLAGLIPEHAEVVELCMGDAYLYENYLALKKVKYLGLDLNVKFVRAAAKKNIPAKTHNILTDEIPPADYIVLQGSLCQFIPNEKIIIRKLLFAARKMLLISEPIKNLADSPNIIISRIARYSANPGTGHAVKRFNKTTLEECFRSFPEFSSIQTTAGGIEMIGIFLKKAVNG